MNRADFQRAKGFMSKDIERELDLARADASKVSAAGVRPGGANFLAALGLLCYTDFAGRLKYPSLKRPGPRFNAFFDTLGQPYAEFRKHHDVYDIFRCGLAHEFYVKRSCTIYMLEKRGRRGIGITRDGRYYMTVEPYYRDFMKAFTKLERQLFP